MSGVQRHAEVTVKAYDPAADHRTRCRFDGDNGTRLALAIQYQAIDAHAQVGWRIRRDGITDNHRAGGRNVAGLVGQGDLKRRAIALARVKSHLKIAARADDARTDLHARSIFDDHGAADFAFTGEDQTIAAHRQVGRCIRRRGVARNHWRDHRHIARLVGQGDVEGLAILLRTVEDDFKAAISPDRSGTYHGAIGCFDRDGAARFAFTGEGQAINAHFKLCRGIRCCGVARNHWRDR